MNALVGQGAPFDRGRQQMKLLADREVATKTVERTAGVVGDDIAQGEPREIQRAVQLDLPVVIGQTVRILYVQMDGTGVPVVKKETVGRPGKTDGAEWIWNWAEQHFPGAVQIVDLFHARPLVGFGSQAASP
jgi:hypothetical protein